MASRRLEVVIAGDSRGAERAFSRTERAAGGFRSKMAGVASTVGTLGLAAATGLGAIGAAAGGWGLKLASDLEQVEVAFTGLLGSGQEATEMMERLREFAQATPFDLPGLAESSRRLLGVGFAAEEVIPALKTIGDVGATLGVGTDEINGVVRALGQMRGKGRASAEELQQISEQLPGFVAIDAVAKGLGITTAEAFKKMEQGAIPAEAAIEAILVGMREFPGAAGAMERQSETLRGVFERLKESVGLGLVDALQPVIPQLKAIAPAVGTALGGLASVLGETFAGIVPALTKAIGPLSKALAPVADVLSTLVAAASEVLGEALTQLAPVLSALADAAKPVINILGDALVTALEALRPIWPVIIDAIKELSPLLQELATQIGAELVGVFEELVPVMIDNAPVWVDLAEAVADLLIALTPIIGPLAKLVALIMRINPKIIQGIAIAIGAVAGALSAVIRFDFAGAWGRITEAISGFARAVGEAIPKVIGWFTELPGRIAEGLGSLATTLVPKAVEMMAGFVQGLVQSVPRAIGFVVALPLLLQKAMGSLIGWLVPKALEFLAGFLSGLIRKLPEIISFMVTLPGRLVGALADLGSWLIPKAIGFLGGFLSGLIRKIPDLLNWVKDLPGKLVNGLGDLGSKLLSAGRDLIAGLWNGIKDFDIIGKIKGFAGDIVGGFTSALGIGSPSKLMAELVGKPIAEGIGVGMTDNMPGVPLPAVPAGMALAGAAGAAGRVVNQNISIRVDGAQNPQLTAQVIVRQLERYERSMAGATAEP